MTSESDTEAGVDAERGLLEYRAAWSLVAGVLGISLWAQLFWFPFATEFLAETTGLLYVGLYVLPVIVLAGSLATGSSAGLLFGVPVATLPGLVIVPEQDAAALLQVHRGIFIAGTAIAYLGAAAVATRADEMAPSERVALEQDEPERLEGLYRYYVSIRLVILVGLFAVLVGAVVFDPSIRQLVVEHHGDEGGASAQIFIAVLGFFTWCVVAYTMFFLPLANVEYDLRRLSRQIDGLASGASGIRWRLGLSVAAGLGAAGAWMLWGSIGL